MTASSQQGAKTIKRLYASTTQRKLSGVCAGIGDYFEVDATVIRLGWIIITILTGIIPGIIAYIVAAIVMPKDTDRSL